MAAFLEQALDMPLREVLAKIQQRILMSSSYHGVKTLKNPLDYWVYQEIIFEEKPDVIIEIGNKWGGSALALAHQLDLLGKGKLIAIDIDHSQIAEPVRHHPKIIFVEQAAVEAFPQVQQLINAGERVLVIEDSSHTFENTLEVLRYYSQFIARGDYLIVEDSICRHGLEVGPKPGPYEAIEAFVEENKKFVIDRAKENFFITWNPKGFLKRVG